MEKLILSSSQLKCSIVKESMGIYHFGNIILKETKQPGIILKVGLFYQPSKSIHRFNKFTDHKYCLENVYLCTGLHRDCLLAIILKVKQCNKGLCGIHPIEDITNCLKSTWSK